MARFLLRRWRICQAVSIRTGLRYAPTSPDADQRVSDSNLEAGITPWGRPEWHDDSNNWFRSYGNENWEFDANGLMQRRFASINDLPIDESERKFYWPLGRRPDDHPGLSELGLQLRH